MSGKKKLILAFLCLAALILNVLVIKTDTSSAENAACTVFVSSDISENVQLFHSPTEAFSEDASAVKAYNIPEEGPAETEALQFSISKDTNFIRLDLGEKAGQWNIEKIVISSKKTEEEVDLGAVSAASGNDIESVTPYAGPAADGGSKNGITVKTGAGDPYIVTPVSFPAVKAELERTSRTKGLLIKIAALIFIDGLALGILAFRKKVLTLPVELIQNRSLILNLAKNDFKTKFAGSYLGIVWAFIQPVVTILVYWFVFSVGFRSGRMDKVPFVLYLIAGIIPWFYFQDTLNSGTNALIEYSYLVKKVVFKISVLPMVKALSAFFVHAFFVLVMIVIYWAYGFHPTLYTLQLVYYFICMFVFVLGICYGTCAIVIFFRDLTQLINIILQVGVWSIPIMWDINVVPESIRFIFRINPMYYVVNGYRDAMYNETWFWQHPGMTLYFWVITAALFALGTFIFKKLKVHFADVL